MPIKALMLSSLLYQRRFLYLLWLISFVFGIIWTGFKTPEQAILFLNQFYNPTLNNIFIGITRLGELSGFLIALVIIIFNFKWRELFGFILTVLLMLLFVWFFKHKIYSDAIRPIVFIENLGLSLPNNSDVVLNRKFSFPSGHTTAAFAFFFFTGLCFQSKRSMAIMFCLALLVGISRVYLAQHFVVDVLAGSLLGVIIATLVYLFMVYRTPWEGSFMDKKIVPRKPRE